MKDISAKELFQNAPEVLARSHEEMLMAEKQIMYFVLNKILNRNPTGLDKNLLKKRCFVGHPKRCLLLFRNEPVGHILKIYSKSEEGKINVLVKFIPL